MPPVRVRAHARRNTGGVRSHIRNLGRRIGDGLASSMGIDKMTPKQKETLMSGYPFGSPDADEIPATTLSPEATVKRTPVKKTPEKKQGTLSGRIPGMKTLADGSQVVTAPDKRHHKPRRKSPFGDLLP